jgi:hypothetical protein
MDSKNLVWRVIDFILLFILIVGCQPQVRLPPKMASLPETFMDAKWGASVGEVKLAAEKGQNRWFEDRTDKFPFVMYATGTYLDTPVVISYFFTPKSKRLFRATVTFDNLTVYEKVKDDLMQKFNKPTYSQKDLNHWAFENQDMVILQKDTTNVQFCFLNGEFAALNVNEGQ